MHEKKKKLFMLLFIISNLNKIQKTNENGKFLLQLQMFFLANQLNKEKRKKRRNHFSYVSVSSSQTKRKYIYIRKREKKLFHLQGLFS
jgi:hypothetical protein